MDSISQFLTLLECTNVEIELDGGTVSYEEIEYEGNWMYPANAPKEGVSAKTFYYKVTYPSGSVRFMGLSAFWDDMSIVHRSFNYEFVKCGVTALIKCYACIK